MTKVFIVAAGLLSFAASGAFGIGPFVDVSALSAFLSAPHRKALDGSLTRADGSAQAASFFNLAASIPVRSSFLLEAKLPYVSVAAGDDIFDGFGDVVLDAKARAWSRESWMFEFTASFRFGSGSAELFPYSTASTDVEAGAAFVDTVGAGGAARLSPLRSLSYWISASYVYVIRMNDRLRDAELHGHHSIAGGGIVAALAPALEIEAGGAGLVFESGAAREIFFTRLSYAINPAARLYATVQAEIGDGDERAVDASATAGLVVAY